jgi:hypothetical protein
MPPLAGLGWYETGVAFCHHVKSTVLDPDPHVIFKNLKINHPGCVFLFAI